MRNGRFNSGKTVVLTSALHFLVDGLCVCGLYLATYPFSTSRLIAVFMTYTLLAFLTQPLSGAWIDRMQQRHWMLLGALVLLTLGVAATFLSVWLSSPTTGMFTVAALLGMGNSLFHVWGGQQTALQTDNDIRALGVYVSTGAFGLAIGTVFFSWPLLFGFLIAIGVLAVFCIFPSVQEGVDCSPHVRMEMGAGLVWLCIIVLMALVVFRSFVSKDFTAGMAEGQTVILAAGAVSMLGKMAGGFVCSHLGIVHAMLLVLTALLFCMLFRQTEMAVQLSGLFLVNCTMPVTLYLANVVLRGREGFAFGLLAAALIPGYLLATLL